MLSSVYAIKQYILQLIYASGWVFYLNIWRNTEPQTLNPHKAVSTFLYFLFTGCPIWYYPNELRLNYSNEEKLFSGM
jgi:hypothetical protein